VPVVIEGARASDAGDRLGKCNMYYQRYMIIYTISFYLSIVTVSLVYLRLIGILFPIHYQLLPKM